MPAKHKNSPIRTQTPKPKKLTPEVIYTLDSLWQLEKTIIDTLDFRQIVHNMVQKVLTELLAFYPDYTFVALFLVNEKKNLLQHTTSAYTQQGVNPLEGLDIPLDEGNNLAIKSIKHDSPEFTYTLRDLVTGASTLVDAHLSKLGKLCIAMPVNVREQAVGAMAFGLQRKMDDLTDMEKSLMQYFTNLIAIAVQNSRLYTNLEAETHQLVDANLNLRNLDKLKDEFISVTSHELRTPMTVIKSYLWLLENEKGGKLSDKQQTYVQKALKGTERMIALINDMLNISKIEQSSERLPTEKLNVKELIEEAVEDFRVKAFEKGLRVETALEDCDQCAYANKQKLKEVLANLLGNAVKFTVSGKISVQLSKPSEKYIKIAVSDTGKGISKENISKLFLKFGRVENTFRTVAEAEGTGLGLYIVKKLIEGMGGEVGAYSDGENKGSTFWFILPRSKPTLTK